MQFHLIIEPISRCSNHNHLSLQKVFPQPELLLNGEPKVRNLLPVDGQGNGIVVHLSPLLQRQRRS